MLRVRSLQLSCLCEIEIRNFGIEHGWDKLSLEAVSISLTNISSVAAQSCTGKCGSQLQQLEET